MESSRTVKSVFEFFMVSPESRVRRGISRGNGQQLSLSPLYEKAESAGETPHWWPKKALRRGVRHSILQKPKVIDSSLDRQTYW